MTWKKSESVIVNPRKTIDKKLQMETCMKFDTVTIAIGATDECDALIKTVSSIMETCNADDIECLLIVIPKNATQQCIETIDFLMKKYPSKVQKDVQRRPYIGGAMQDAIEDVNTSHIMFFAADLTINLDCVPLMIEKSKNNPDIIVKASRWLEKNSFYGYNKAKKVFNYLAQSFLQLLFNSDITDFTSPVLISPTEIYKKANFKEMNFPCLLEAILLPLRMGCKFEEVPVKCFQRTEGKSKNSVLQTMLYLKPALRIRFTKKENLIKK